MPSYDNLLAEYEQYDQQQQQQHQQQSTPSSNFLSAPSSSALRKSSSRQSLSLNVRRSSASLRTPSSLAQSLGDDPDGVNGRHSLAHELAVALMPEPSAGSKLLAEEFGIEYDEGAEGIDEKPPLENGGVEDSGLGFQEPGAGTEAWQLGGGEYESAPSPAAADFDPTFGESPASPKRRRKQQPQPQQQRLEQDPMVVLAQDMEYTEKFLVQLRRLDAGDGSGASHANLEQLTSDVIRRLNETVRDREEQVRELIQCEREFRKMGGEMGGMDVLGGLDKLEDLVSETAQQDNNTAPTHTEPIPPQTPLDAIAEESVNVSQADWEVDPDRDQLADEDDEYEMDESMYVPSSAKADFPPPPPMTGPPTPANTIPQLAHLRTFTASTAASLATVLEHTQVNAAATTEAGRKIRALKNKLGGWRTEWDSAERSRLKIEKWEAGIVDDGDAAANADLASIPRSMRRIDGRKLVQEQLQAFEKILNEANIKTQSIMAAVAVS